MYRITKPGSYLEPHTTNLGRYTEPQCSLHTLHSLADVHNSQFLISALELCNLKFTRCQQIVSDNAWTKALIKFARCTEYSATMLNLGTTDFQSCKDVCWTMVNRRQEVISPWRRRQWQRLNGSRHGVALQTKGKLLSQLIVVFSAVAR